MKNKKWFLRKRFLFPIIYVVELAVFLTIAQIFGFGETGLLPYADFPTRLYIAVCISIMILTTIAFLIKIIKDYKKEYPWVKSLYCVIAYIALTAIPSILLVLGVIQA